MSTPTSATSTSQRHIVYGAPHPRVKSWSESRSQPNSQPSTPTSASLPQPPDFAQKKTKPPSRASSAILGGTDRILALFDEEREKIEASTRVLISKIEAEFQIFRERAAAKEHYLNARVKELEVEVAAMKQNSAVLPQSEVEGLQSQSGGEGVAGMEAGVIQNPTQTMDTSGYVSIDDETVHLVQQLVIHMRQAASAQKPLESGASVNLFSQQPGQVATIPDLFLPALAQYLTNHKKVLHDLEEKSTMSEKQRGHFLFGLSEVTPSVAPTVEPEAQNSPKRSFREVESALEVDPNVKCAWNNSTDTGAS